MPGLEELDLRIEALDPWIRRAGTGLLTFHLADQPGYFLRDTLSDVPGATSTLRAFVGLLEYLRVLMEEDATGGLDEAEASRVTSLTLDRMIKEPKALREMSSNGLNMFTDSHFLLAISMIASGPIVDSLSRNGQELQGLLGHGEEVAREISSNLEKWKGGLAQPEDRVPHDFITLHAARALDGFAYVKGDTWDPPAAMEQRVEEDVLRHLGFRFGDVTSRFDPSELAFSVALLSRFRPRETFPAISAATRAIVQAQSPDGSFPTARIVSYSGKNLLHVSSYEVGLALCGVALREIYRSEQDTTLPLLQALHGCFRLAESTYLDSRIHRGWANDHTRVPELLESWATAIVLLFLIHYRDVLRERRQLLLLEHYRARHRVQHGSTPPWPDLGPALAKTSAPPENALKGLSDPTPSGSLAEVLREQALGPIMRSKIRRPEIASMVIYGPPGTRKTSLVRAVAQALDWPFLELSPPNFLHDGLEGFERAAAEVFGDLLRLRRVVVLFDECEGFFQRREERQQLEARTVGAFITSGMLPRLQALRDQRWVLFCLTMNDDIRTLDPATTRPGRFDRALYLGGLGPEAIERYVSASRLPDEKKPILLQGVRQAPLRRFGPRRPRSAGGDPSITFAHLDDLIRSFANIPLEDMTPKQVSRRFRDILRSEGPPPLL